MGKMLKSSMGHDDQSGTFAHAPRKQLPGALSYSDGRQPGLWPTFREFRTAVSSADHHRNCLRSAVVAVNDREKKIRRYKNFKR